MATPPTIKVLSRPDGGLALEGALSFTTVTTALSRLQPHLAGGASRIDLSGVDHADSAGLALLVECVKAARQRGHDVRFEQVPAQLAALAAACGLTRLLTPVPDDVPAD